MTERLQSSHERLQDEVVRLRRELNSNACAAIPPTFPPAKWLRVLPTRSGTRSLHQLMRAWPQMIQVEDASSREGRSTMS